MFGKKTIRVNGIAYTISKLSPDLFLGEDYYPLNNIIEKSDISVKQIEKEKDVIKDLMEKTISRSIVKIKKGFSNVSIAFAMKSIMDNAELYAYLFSEIIRLSFGIKKKTKYLFS